MQSHYLQRLLQEQLDILLKEESLLKQARDHHEKNRCRYQLLLDEAARDIYAIRQAIREES